MLTKKQQQEVDYLITWCKKPVSSQEIEEYIQITTKGGNGGKFSNNPLIQAQQRLNVTLSMWKEDLVNGLISFDELMEESSCEYERKLITSVRDSVTPNYRRKTLRNGTVLSFTNFPELTKVFKR